MKYYSQVRKGNQVTFLESSKALFEIHLETHQTNLCIKRELSQPPYN